MQDAVRYALKVACGGAVSDDRRGVPSPIGLRREVRKWLYTRYDYARHHVNPVCRTAEAMLRSYRRTHGGELRVPEVKRSGMRIDGGLRVVNREVRVTLQPDHYAWLPPTPRTSTAGGTRKGRHPSCSSPTRRYAFLETARHIIAETRRDNQAPMPIKMLTMEDLDIDGKRVFARVDINTPIHPETGELMEQARFEEAVMTISDLHRSKVVVASHQGRVGRSDYTSLEVHAKVMAKMLGKKVRFVPDVFGPEALSEMDSLSDGDVLVLDNLRFAAEENQEYKPADAEKTFMVQRIKPHVDVCVLDAFSTAHRSSPSIVGFAGLVPTCAGRTVGKELRMLDRIFSVEKGPYVTVLGGAKVSDRLEAVDALIANNRADKVLLCGVVGLIFLRAAGKLQWELGVDGEQKLVARAKQLLEDDPERYALPSDVAVDADGRRKEVGPGELKARAKVLDIGSKTVDSYSHLIKGAGTVFMSGPPGAFEWDEFSAGTEGLLRAMASSFGTTIISGGHLSTALRKYGIHEQIDHTSTAGGALVQYLAGKRLPLIDALERAAEKWGGKPG